MVFQSFLMIFDDFSLKLRGVRGAAAPRGPVFLIWGYPLDSQGAVIMNAVFFCVFVIIDFSLLSGA